MKSVVISIRPEWSVKIAKGEKTIEVRKTKPKLATPFKCYIYQTLPKSGDWNERDGHVIGEFVCDRIDTFLPRALNAENDGYVAISNPDPKVMSKTCLSGKEMFFYGSGKRLYGWHISNLVIYGKPIKLTAFKRPCPTEQPCALCRHAELHPDGMLMCENRVFNPPQSWCYVEGAKCDAD